MSTAPYELLEKILVWPNPLLPPGRPAPAVVRRYDRHWNLLPPIGWRPVIEPLEFLRYPMPERAPQLQFPQSWPVSPWVKLMMREIERRGPEHVLAVPWGYR